MQKTLLTGLVYANEQLFTKVEVNRPGYSPSHEGGEVNYYTGLFTDTEVNNYIILIAYINQ